MGMIILVNPTDISDKIEVETIERRDRNFNLISHTVELKYMNDRITMQYSDDGYYIDPASYFKSLTELTINLLIEWKIPFKYVENQ